jgi:hypothetical protein
MDSDGRQAWFGFPASFLTAILGSSGIVPRRAFFCRVKASICLKRRSLLIDNASSAWSQHGVKHVEIKVQTVFLHETSRLAVPGTHVFIFSWIPDLDIQVHHDLSLKKLRIFKKASTGKHFQRLANTGKHGGKQGDAIESSKGQQSLLCLHEVHNEVTNYIVRKYMDSF